MASAGSSRISSTIAFISRYCTLEPGDLIATGVALGPAGSDEVMLRDGDIVEGTVDGVGTLRNPVGRQARIVHFARGKFPTRWLRRGFEAYLGLRRVRL